jgi:hypothetical protein
MRRFPLDNKRVMLATWVRKSHAIGRKVDKRRSLPPLNALRAFEAAARHSSFKHAADELGVTHGAISRHVRLLEDWLGPPALFLRLNRRVELTATGAALLAETATALDRLSAATARHLGQSGKPSPEILRVNAFSTFSLRWLLPRLGSPPRCRGPALHFQRSFGLLEGAVRCDHSRRAGYFLWLHFASVSGRTPPAGLQPGVIKSFTNKFSRRSQSSYFASHLETPPDLA